MSSAYTGIVLIPKKSTIENIPTKINEIIGELEPVLLYDELGDEYEGYKMIKAGSVSHKKTIIRYICWI